MRNLFLLLLSVFFFAQISAQTEKVSYKTAADKFEELYNNGKYSDIYNMFTPEMKNALPFPKTVEFLNGLHSQAGAIVKRQFIRYVKSTYAAYKTNFERGLFELDISVDNNSLINGLYVKPYTDTELPKPERNSTALQLPFNGEWTVFWGGDTKEQNYHVENVAQKNAFDLMIVGSSGKSYKTDGQTNEDYYAFGEPLIAPADGEVVLVVDGIKDNKPGEMNPYFVTGNTVILKTAANEYLLFAHFKQHSIKVKQGQKIKQGELLGLCGNSGNSSEAHLHFHIQNTEDLNKATGIKCYFSNIIVNGVSETNYSPVKKDKIRNSN